MPNDKKAIKTEQQFILTFLQQSVGLYVKSKSNEHSGTSTNYEMLVDAKQDFDNLIDGLSDNAKKYIDHNTLRNMTNALKANLGDYVSVLDEELSESRNQILLKKGLHSANSLQADEAMRAAGEKLGAKLKEIDVEDLKTVFSTMRDLCKAYKLDKVADIFDWMHQREQAKYMITSVRVNNDSVNVSRASAKVSKDTLTR